MRDDKILELKKQIIEGNVTFLDSVLECLEKNKVLYSDNYGECSEKVVHDIEYLEPFMYLLYRGSKHSIGSVPESCFSRVVVYKGHNLKFKYYSGPETYVTVVEIENIANIKPIVTLELLKERLTEAEEVKSELAPIIEKYLKAGLTFEEITRMFVEIMRENRIQI